MCFTFFVSVESSQDTDDSEPDLLLMSSSELGSLLGCLDTAEISSFDNGSVVLSARNVARLLTFFSSKECTLLASKSVCC